MIPFLDLAGDFAAVEADARARIDAVLARQQFVLGPETAELERSIARRLDAGSAIAVSSGTEALALSLLALGVGPGDAVVLPAFTFFASAGAVCRVGAQPVFCDIDRGSFLADPSSMRSAIDRQFRREGGRARHRRSGARLAALMPVHLYGRACQMNGVLEVAEEVGAVVVEDAAQAIDCRIGGRSVGRFGSTGCFSFYPTKNLGGAGDGGLILCDDSALAARLLRLRSHGSDVGSYEHHEVGVNARMGELVAAVLNAKLSMLEAWTTRRRQLAALYDAQLAPAVDQGLLELPTPAVDGGHVWHQYAVRIPGPDRRDGIKQKLEDDGIASRVFYPLPLHRQPCFSGDGAESLPAAEEVSREVLCLPIYPSLDDTGAAKVAQALLRAVGVAS